MTTRQLLEQFEQHLQASEYDVWWMDSEIDEFLDENPNLPIDVGTSKAILVYDLPDDAKAHLRAAKSLDMVFALWDVDQYLRRVDRHDMGDNIEEIRDNFYSLLEARGIILDDLIE
jgi:hypothetical protein